ncbi:MAG: copper resistance protein NlpE [Alphaproteobacteria bacterium]|nr:copper resistance protein NlpE [Alphaproteobacteria bacterium]
MKSYFKYLMILPLLFTLAACDENKQTNDVVDVMPPEAEVIVTETEAMTEATQEEVMATEHNSQNALDWAGAYRGVVPCADCEGIEMVLTIGNDMNFVLLSNYLGKSEEPLRDEGTFAWNEGGSIITFEVGGEKRSFQVGEGQLFMLDNEGNRVEGENADKYILSKQQD